MDPQRVALLQQLGLSTVPVPMGVMPPMIPAHGPAPPAQTMPTAGTIPPPGPGMPGAGPPGAGPPAGAGPPQAVPPRPPAPAPSPALSNLLPVEPDEKVGPLKHACSLTSPTNDNLQVEFYYRWRLRPDRTTEGKACPKAARWPATWPHGPS